MSNKLVSNPNGFNVPSLSEEQYLASDSRTTHTICLKGIVPVSNFNQVAKASTTASPERSSRGPRMEDWRRSLSRNHHWS